MKWKLIAMSAVLGILWFVAYYTGPFTRTAPPPKLEAAATHEVPRNNSMLANDRLGSSSKAGTEKWKSVLDELRQEVVSHARGRGSFFQLPAR